MQTTNRQAKEVATRIAITAEVANPLVEHRLVMKWVETGKDYPKLEARWVFEDADR